MKMFKDALTVLDEDENSVDPPLTGAVYIGCYEDEIASLLVWHKDLVHFYVRKPYRGKSKKYYQESEKLIASELLYCLIPDNKRLIKFAEIVGYKFIQNKDDLIVMGKLNGDYRRSI